MKIIDEVFGFLFVTVVILFIATFAIFLWIVDMLMTFVGAIIWTTKSVAREIGWLIVGKDKDV